MIRADRGMLEGRLLIASSEQHPECAGRDLDKIAAEWGVAKDEAARRLQPGSAIYFLMDEADVRGILSFDETMIGSRRHSRRRAAASAPLGHVPARAWTLQPRCRPVPARGAVAPLPARRCGRHRGEGGPESDGGYAASSAPSVEALDAVSSKEP